MSFSRLRSRWCVACDPQPEPPQGWITEQDGSRLIVPSKRVVRVSGATRVEWLHTSPFGWSATSVVRASDGKLYSGARYFVVELVPTPDGYVERWLAPTGATRPKPTERP